MLCNVVENGKRKCEQYYPETAEETVRFGRFSILAREPVVTKNQQAFKITPLVIADGNEIHNLEHIHWVDWPDRSVPEDNFAWMQLVPWMRKRSPTLVHCSAGIGRSGTIVGLDILCCRLANEELVTLKQVVTELRKMRDGAVQVDVQYIYMARCMVELALQQRVVTAIEMMSFVKAYEEFCTQHLCTTD